MARTSKATDQSKRRRQGTADQEALQGLDLDFSRSPTVWRFLNDDSFVRGLMGPVGSGKSYGSAAEIILRAVKQAPSPVDHVRYTRWAIIRNSYPELRTTTIKTWQSLFPENTWGPMRWSPPITHHIKLPPRGPVAGIDCEVLFLALDQPKDVRKLLSLELTGAWINEARELPKAVVDGLTSRVGRFPTKEHGKATWRGIWMDTNPMDDDHWWHKVAEKEPIRGDFRWTFFRQPGGVVDVPDEGDNTIFAAGRHWIENPSAENINNLPPGYYVQQLAGKNLDWIRCYAQGEYVYVQEGKPVWHEYDDTLMSGDVPIVDGVEVHIGLDFGLTPAAVFGQKIDGRWHVVHELVSFSMGLERFTHMLLSELNTKFRTCRPLIWGDPAGMKRDEIFEVTAFDHLQSVGLKAQPTASNDFMVRREAAAAPMQRLINGRPGIIVDKKCQKLRKSLAGGYHFKRVAIGAGQERFKDSPHKNEHSHVGDAFGYMLMGGGEHRYMTRGRVGSFQQGQALASTDFDVW